MTGRRVSRMALCALLVGTAGLAIPRESVAQAGWERDDRWESDFYGDLRSREGDASSSGDRAPEGVARSSATASTASRATGANFTQAASVPQGYIPWSGTWWTRKQCDLAFHDFGGGLSPLEKYDSIVASLYGRLPGATAWEADPIHHHNYGASNEPINWGGHCNGLAAASILMPEPRNSFEVPLGTKPVKVKLTARTAAEAKEYLYSDGKPDYRKLDNPGKSVTLTVADMKGLLCEAYMTCYTQQFENRKLTGTRYDRTKSDASDEAFRDIHPHYFHWLLQEFVKKNGQVIVAEVDPGFSVNNHPVYKYETNAVYDKAKKKYSVTTKCYFADYAKSAQFVGTVTSMRTYTYDLHQDESGRIVRGEWTGASVKKHPDFCWIPTSDAPPYQTLENASVNGDFVRHLFSQYGSAQQ